MDDTNLAENTTSQHSTGFAYTLSICCMRRVIILLHVPCFSCVSCEPYRCQCKQQLHLEQNRAEFMTSHLQLLLYDVLSVGKTSRGFVVFCILYCTQSYITLKYNYDYVHQLLICVIFA